MKGINLKMHKTTLLQAQSIMFGLLCMGIGAIICFFYMTHFQINRLEAVVKEYEEQTELLIETTEYLRTWKGLVDDMFGEHTSAIRRLEHLMRVPIHARQDAARKYNAFNADEQEE